MHGNPRDPVFDWGQVPNAGREDGFGNCRSKMSRSQADLRAGLLGDSGSFQQTKGSRKEFSNGKWADWAELRCASLHLHRRPRGSGQVACPLWTHPPHALSEELGESVSRFPPALGSWILLLVDAQLLLTLFSELLEGQAWGHILLIYRQAPWWLRPGEREGCLRNPPQGSPGGARQAWVEHRTGPRPHTPPKGHGDPWRPQRSEEWDVGTGEKQRRGICVVLISRLF